MQKNYFPLVAVLLLITILLTSCEKEQKVIEVTGIDLNIQETEILKGKSLRLIATVVPPDATNAEIEWVVTDDVITVDEDGLVTAVRPGEASVIARSGDIISECKIHVLEIMASGIDIEQSEINLHVGESTTVTATISPDNSDETNIIWSSSKNNVASVDNTGKVTAIASGYTTITASLGSCKDSCNLYVIGAPQVGDFYYSDGRWFTEPIPDKVPVGIIFYVGDPSVSDKALQKDHPECVNGLVMALFGESSVAWQTKDSKYGALVSDWAKNNDEASQYVDIHQGTYGDYLNEIMGYNNTKVYELFNKDEANIDWKIDAITVLENFRADNPLPESTSGWYIPSAKEISLMVNGEYDGNIGSMSESILMNEPDVDMAIFLNQRMYMIPGAYLFSPLYYWSSTEGDIKQQMLSKTYNQWSINMETGYVFGVAKYANTTVIRPVFAF